MRHVRLLISLYIVLAGGSTSSASARVWLVDWAGDGDFIRVTDACNAATAGDTIHVMPGQYDEETPGYPDVQLENKPITLMGLGSPSDIRIRMTMLFSECGRTTIQGLTFYNSAPALVCGYGVLACRECRFVDNSGRALWGAAYSTLELENCGFSRNYCPAGIGGGGAVIAESIRARECCFFENETPDHGGAINAGGEEVVLEDCLFVRNRAGNGAAIRLPADPTIIGCTFYGNEVTEYGGAAIEFEARLWAPIERCVVAGTVNGYGIGCYAGAEIRCFCFWDNDAGNTAGWIYAPEEFGNFEADPLFCDPATNDFGLNEGSPCLPGEHGGYACDLIGAFDLGCGASPVKETTWGRIKTRFSAKAK